MKWNKPYTEYWKQQLQQSKLLQILKDELRGDFNNISLNDIDNFLKKNYTKITCAELSAIYIKFFLDLKNIKSNSVNFVGFSEFLILRTLLHLLNEKYYPTSKLECLPKNENIGFFNFGNGDLILTTESIEKKFWGNQKRPDIILYRDDWSKLFGIVSIKACQVDRTNIENEITFLKNLEEKMKNENLEYLPLNGLVIVFAKTNVKDENVCQLWGDTRPISKVLREKLNLDKINSNKEL